MAWKWESREQPALPALPSRVHLRTVFLGEETVKRESVPGGLKGGYLGVERSI